MQVESPLQTAEKLSEEFGNTILLKREDLQVRRTGALAPVAMDVVQHPE